MFGRKIHVGQGFFHTFLDFLGCGQELHLTELSSNGNRFFLSGFFALLRVNCLEHQGNLLHLILWCHCEDVPVKMDRAALVFGFRKDFRDAFQHAKAFIADNETHACKAAAFEPGEKVQPAFLVLFHALRCAEDLTESVFIDANGD